MSPFVLATGELVSCLAYGREHPLEHAGSCACPCPPCVEMQRTVLEQVGTLPSDVRPRHLFLYAYEGLRVSPELRAGDDADYWFMDVYRELEATADAREAVPAAAFGWLLPAAGSDDALRAVKAPSDPSGGRADEALSAWASERGVTLVDLWDEPQWDER